MPKTKVFILALITVFGGLVGVLTGVFFSRPTSTSAKYVKDKDLRIREQMVVISRQLGVTCAYCHDVKNLRSSKMKNFGIAKEHIRVTKLINQKGFKGSPKVDCYTCHRGKAKPDYKEVLKD